MSNGINTETKGTLLMRRIDLEQMQQIVADMFPNDAPCEGGAARLEVLQAEANGPFETDNEAGRNTERARHIMKLAREYRQVQMGMVDA